MSETFDSHETDDRSNGHLTTRRGFVTAAGFGVVSLYGLWAAYGAAPTNLAAILSGAGGAEGGERPVMEEMPGMGGGHSITPDEFRRLNEAFIAENELPDGSVKPRRRPKASKVASLAHATQAGKEEDEIDVYLMAQRYYYEPEVLRLDANVPYRFRMMAMDTTHGVSILGSVQLGGHIMRSPAGALAQMTMTFTRVGEYLVYCTVYCGEGHGGMTGKIIVA